MNNTGKPIQFDRSGIDISYLKIAPSSPQMPEAPPIDDGVAHLQDELASITDKLKSLQESGQGDPRHRLVAQMLMSRAAQGFLLIQAKTLMEGAAETLNQKPLMNDEVPK